MNLTYLLLLCTSALAITADQAGEFELRADKHSSNSSSTPKSATKSASSSEDKSSTETSEEETSSISINPVLPPGGVNLKTPASTSTTYVKSGQNITFGWNFTSLILTPKALNIEAICTQNSQTYTLAQNQSVKTSSVVWDTSDVEKDGKLHLITSKYTLRIYDSEGSPDDVATAGKLSPFTYIFGVYIPQDYTAWPGAAKFVNSATSPTGILTMLTTTLFAFVLLLI